MIFEEKLVINTLPPLGFFLRRCRRQAYLECLGWFSVWSVIGFTHGFCGG